MDTFNKTLVEKYLDFPPEINKYIFKYCEIKKINNENIRDAVKLWIYDKNKCLLIYGHISYWDVSRITDMSGLFGFEENDFNEDISLWNTFNVKDMCLMFDGAQQFNQDISHWDVGNVEDMTGMFSRASLFNQDVSRWNVGKVKYMNCMFMKASSFNQDISSWDVGNVENMSRMFARAISFNQDISRWNVGNVVIMYGMFHGAYSFNQDISDWDIKNVTNMSCMFYEALSFNQDLSKWNIYNVDNMDCMFHGACSYNRTLFFNNYYLACFSFSSELSTSLIEFEIKLPGPNSKNGINMLCEVPRYDQIISFWNYKSLRCITNYYLSRFKNIFSNIGNIFL